MYLLGKLETTEYQHQAKTTKEGYIGKDKNLFIRLTAYIIIEQRNRSLFLRIKFLIQQFQIYWKKGCYIFLYITVLICTDKRCLFEYNSVIRLQNHKLDNKAFSL